MSDYRLEACSTCDVVCLVFRTAITQQRERERADPIEWFGDTPVYRVAFCGPCRREYYGEDE